MHDGGGGEMGLEGGGSEGGRGCTAAPAAEGAEQSGAASSLQFQFQTSSPTRAPHMSNRMIQNPARPHSSELTVNNRPEVKRPV